MNYSQLITDSIAFSALRNECDLIFDMNKRLPERVFRQNFTEYYAFAYDHIDLNDFAAVLANIACRFGDRAVNYMTVVPDPVGYYFKHCGFYGLASFDPSTLINDYIKVMSRDGNVESFRSRGGDVGILWGSSLEWGIFCDRISWELCLMASRSPVDESIMTGVKVMDAAQLRDYELNVYRNRPTLALEFLRDLSKNYPTLGSL
jgi:hypothetical protein